MDLWPWNISSELLRSDALAILLQHPSFGRDQTIVCSLLRSSKAAAAAVRQCSAGQLAVICKPQGHNYSLHGFPKPFLSWISSHAALLKSLEFTHGGHTLPAAVIAQLPPSLTALDAGVSAEAALAALSRLSGLHSLNLKLQLPGSGIGYVNRRPLALQQLTSLSTLKVTAAAAPVNNLPITVFRDYCSLQVCSYDHLPPKTAVLHVPAVLSFAPIVKLQSLRELRIDYSTSTAEQLLQLTALSSLEQLDLTYRAAGSADAAAAAWPALPLHSLSVLGGGLSAASVQQGLQDKAAGLQQLTLHVPVEALAGPLARALEKFTGLTALRLQETSMTLQFAASGQARADMASLMAAYKKLDPAVRAKSSMLLKPVHMHQYFPALCECEECMEEDMFSGGCSCGCCYPYGYDSDDYYSD